MNGLHSPYDCGFEYIFINLKNYILRYQAQHILKEQEINQIRNELLLLVLIGLQVGLKGFSEVKQSTEQKKITDQKTN